DGRMEGNCSMMSENDQSCAREVTDSRRAVGLAHGVALEGCGKSFGFEKVLVWGNSWFREESWFRKRSWFWVEHRFSGAVALSFIKGALAPQVLKPSSSQPV